MSTTTTPSTCDHGSFCRGDRDDLDLECTDCGLHGRMPACTIQGSHCENCGSTDYEDLECGDQGYTACCNELVAWSSSECRAHHNSPTWPAR